MTGECRETADRKGPPHERQGSVLEIADRNRKGPPHVRQGSVPEMADREGPPHVRQDSVPAYVRPKTEPGMADHESPPARTPSWCPGVGQTFAPRHLAGALLAGMVAIGSAAFAQEMPDPSQIAGRPLPAPELSDGSISVRVVRERMGNNITGQLVTLKGPNIDREARTDGQGRVLFIGLAPGTVVRAESTVDGEVLRSQDISVPPAGGLRVALIAGVAAAAARAKADAEAMAAMPARPGTVTFGDNTRIIFEFQDDNLRAFYLLDVVNAAKTPIDPGALVLTLPDGATGAVALEGSSPLATVNGTEVTFRGPFPPGTTQVQVGYTVPWSGREVHLQQRWPAAIEELFVAAEKLDGLTIASPQFTAQREASSGGAPFLMATGGRVNAGETLSLTLSGLPARTGLLRDAGVALAALLLVVGLWAAWRAKPADAVPMAQLEARRESLYGELARLDLKSPPGTPAGARAAGRRQVLVSELERVLGQLDSGTGEAGRGALEPRVS